MRVHPGPSNILLFDIAWKNGRFFFYLVYRRQTLEEMKFFIFSGFSLSLHLSSFCCETNEKKKEILSFQTNIDFFLARIFILFSCLFVSDCCF